MRTPGRGPLAGRPRETVHPSPSRGVPGSIPVQPNRTQRRARSSDDCCTCGLRTEAVSRSLRRHRHGMTSVLPSMKRTQANDLSCSSHECCCETSEPDNDRRRPGKTGSQTIPGEPQIDAHHLEQRAETKPMFWSKFLPVNGLRSSPRVRQGDFLR